MRQQLRGDLDRHRQDLRPKIESALPLAELDGMRLSGFRSRLITNCLRTDQSAQRRGRASRGEMQPRAGMVVPATLQTQSVRIITIISVQVAVSFSGWLTQRRQYVAGGGDESDGPAS